MEGVGGAVGVGGWVVGVSVEVGVEGVCDGDGGGVGNFPEGGDDVGESGELEGRGQVCFVPCVSKWCRLWQIRGSGHGHDQGPAMSGLQVLGILALRQRQIPVPVQPAQQELRFQCMFVIVPPDEKLSQGIDTLDGFGLE